MEQLNKLAVADSLKSLKQREAAVHGLCISPSCHRPCVSGCVCASDSIGGWGVGSRGHGPPAALVSGGWLVRVAANADALRVPCRVPILEGNVAAGVGHVTPEPVCAHKVGCLSNKVSHVSHSIWAPSQNTFASQSAVLASQPAGAYPHLIYD